jgi:hypothetical protein
VRSSIHIHTGQAINLIHQYPKIEQANQFALLK